MYVKQNIDYIELIQLSALYDLSHALCKKASNHHANLPLEMYSFTL